VRANKSKLLQNMRSPLHLPLLSSAHLWARSGPERADLVAHALTAVNADQQALNRQSGILSPPDSGMVAGWDIYEHSLP
jgi:hypothetical protein